MSVLSSSTLIFSTSVHSKALPSASRKESKKVHSFLNNQNGFSVDYESDLIDISWNDSENIIMNRIHIL